MKLPALLLALLLAAATVCADTFRHLAAQEALAEGDVISLVSLSPGTSGQWIEGRAETADRGLVGLAAGDLGPNSRTRWRVHESAPGILAFECLGFTDGPAWLNGGTIRRDVVLALNPAGVSGAHWALYREGAGFTFKCLGKAPGTRWLIAGPERSVALAEAPENAPSLWQVCVWHKAARPQKPIVSAPPTR